MKYSKRYLVLTIILFVTVFLKFNTFGQDYAQIDRFRGGNLVPEVWNPLVADEMNSGGMTLLIDNKEYRSDSVHFYMDENRNIMVPVSILRDALNCSAHIYADTQLLVEKHSLSVSFFLDGDKALVGEEEVPVQSALQKAGEEYYVSLNDLSGLLQYSWNFDIKNRIMATADTLESTANLPVKYDLREKGRISQIRDQGAYGTCWAFAAISALESSLLPEENPAFSVDHMSLSNSFHVNQQDGGEYTMGMAYLAAWQGPVYEEDDPYGDGESDSTLIPVRHVQEMRIIDGKDYEGIKAAVFKYGGVESSLYSTLRSSQSNSLYYDKEHKAYCYIGTEKPNHDVVIIGWDDNYPKENFPVSLEGDGAFICQNSWGEEFGDGGIFYVSYYDTNIGTHNVVYTRVEETDNYDHIYQSDLCGWVGQMGYDEREHIYGANVFTAEGNEEIAAASFYATGAGTSYQLYVVNNYKDESSFSARQMAAEGTLTQAGYYTIDFKEPVPVAKGEKYAIVLYVSTPGSTHPMAIEYDTGDALMESVDLNDGEGYISYNGIKFVNVKSKNDCNLCIKAFTNNR